MGRGADQRPTARKARAHAAENGAKLVASEHGCQAVPDGTSAPPISAAGPQTIPLSTGICNRYAGGALRYFLSCTRTPDSGSVCRASRCPLPPARRRSIRVLSELWHAKSRRGSDVLQVQLSSEGCSGAQVQGDDAHGESAGGARRWPAGLAAGPSGASGGPAAARRGLRAEPAKGHDGRRSTHGRRHSVPAASG
jgi:hypothetical protein